jgi:hypothetical protein
VNSYSLWDEIHGHNNSFCGQYISMYDLYQAQLQGTNSIHVNFPVIIGFDDLLPFQNFSDFPSCVLGDFKLIIRVSPDALVWCTVDPWPSIKQLVEIYPFTEDGNKNIFNYNQFANLIDSSNQQSNYDHRFTQANSWGRAATNCASDITAIGATPTQAGFKGVDILLKPRQISTYLAQSIITGYKLNTAILIILKIFILKNLLLYVLNSFIAITWVRIHQLQELMQQNNSNSLT